MRSRPPAAGRAGVRRAWTWWLVWGLLGLVVALTAATIAADVATPDVPGTSNSLVGNVSLLGWIYGWAWYPLGRRDHLFVWLRDENP